MICGSLEVTIMQSTVYWKNAFQQNLPFTLNPRTLYRGYIPSVTNTAAMIGSQFGLASMFKRKYLEVFGKTNKPDSLDALFFGTLCGGYISGFWCGPIELAMIQQQRFGMTLSQCLRKIVGEYGIQKGVFRGTFNTSMREGTFLFLKPAFYISKSQLFSVLVIWDSSPPSHP
jgi:hypothetical protein